MTYPIEYEIDRIKHEYQYSDYPREAKDDIETLLTELSRFNDINISEMTQAYFDTENKLEIAQNNISKLLNYIEKNVVNVTEEIKSIGKQYDYDWDEN